MPTTIATTAGELLASVPAHTVKLKQHWSDPFAAQAWLYCDTAAKRAAPDKSSAILHYDYGWIVRPGAAAPVYYPPLSIDNWFVCVVIDQFDAAGNPTTPITWYGVVRERADDAYGTPLGNQNGQQNPGAARQPTGTQKFTCYGLEDLLYREALRSSTVENPLFLQQPGQPAEVDIGRPLVFNGGPGHSHDQLTPNRSILPGVLGSSIFAGSLEAANCQSWATFDIVDYLLAYRTPRNFLNAINVPFLIDAVSGQFLPDWDQPRLAPKHESIGELLEKLISRKRLVGYYFDVDAANLQGSQALAPVTLYAFTFTAQNLSVPTQYYNAAGDLVPGTATIAANPDQVALDFDLATDVEYAQLRRVLHDQYDQVRVRGARKTSTFSVSFLDNDLVPDWDTTALESEYETAASTQPDYPLLNAQAQQRNHLWRSGERYLRVYRWFRLPWPGNGTAGNGEGTGLFSPVFPVDDQFTQLNTFYRPELLLLPFTGLWSDKTYVGAPYAWLDIRPPNGRPERLRAMAFLKVTTADGTTRYQPVEKLSDVLATDKHTLGGAHFNCSLRMQDKAAGVILEVHGQHQHAIAKTDFTPLTKPTGSVDITPPLDYRNNLIATVAAEHDHHAEGIWPPDAQVTGGVDYLRTLLIDLSHLEGHQALRVDYLVPGTVVGIRDGVLQRSDGGYVRDDRGRLNATAQMAFQWYSQERQALELKIRFISGAFFIGQLITSIGSGASLQQVNTPVTSIVWDLLNGTTTVTTGYGELDFNVF